MEPLTPVRIEGKNTPAQTGEFIFEHKNNPTDVTGNGIARVRVRLDKANKHYPDGWRYFDVGTVTLTALSESAYVAVAPFQSQNTTCKRDGFVRHDVIGKRPDATEFVWRCRSCGSVKVMSH